MYLKRKTSPWTQKGGTLSDKSARKEFGLTQEEILEAINSCKIQHRMNFIFGNPYFRLIRSEVEALVNEKYGDSYLEKKKLKKELAQTKSELKKLKTRIKSLEEKKAELMKKLGGHPSFISLHFIKTKVGYESDVRG
ncbi:hypothetical protein [Desulfonema magnum]|uniref:Uncharacterized protein n=1 Tax=Desulfonema magnum TaxID=45655 RepID=A0A975BJI8_9BACT|nr:hypothetical protein [Desulfonema magnum]QTA86481.1 Uncharacterized protein dnm_025040 [Desulfonema magnum]